MTTEPHPAAPPVHLDRVSKKIAPGQAGSKHYLHQLGDALVSDV